jgi:hypothetical protein
MRVKFEFDTNDENFDQQELDLFYKAKDIIACLWELSQEVKKYYKYPESNPCNPDTVHEFFWNCLQEHGIDFDKMYT